MNVVTAANLIDRLAIALLVMVLLQVLTRRLSSAIGIVCVQGALLTAIATAVAIAADAPHAFVGAALTAAVRMFFVPVLLWAALQRVQVKIEKDPVLPPRLMLVIGIGLILVAYQAAGAVPLPGAIPSRHALPVGLALMLIGMFLMIARRKAVSQVIALVTIENGIALAALIATAGMPLAVELGLSFDLLIGIALMGIFAGRISQTFQTTNVDYLRELRG